MKREQRYGVRSLQTDFPDDDACLDFIFDARHSRSCSCGGTYKRLSGRKQYQCSKCRFQIAPTAGTIFHKSDTPLTLWFQAILTFSNAKSSVSAKELERELEVTYKTAWRILSLIRKALKQDNDKLSGSVEIDTGYFGGKGYGGKYNKNQSAVILSKSIVAVAIQRGGEARAQVIEDASTYSMMQFIDAHIADGSRMVTDGSQVFKASAKTREHEAVNHRAKEYVRGDVHVNNVETFFGHLKRSMKGTHKAISKKHLQAYLDAFVFHYNNRHSDKARFEALLGKLVPAGA